MEDVGICDMTRVTYAMAVLVSLQGVVCAQQNRIAGRISGSQRFTLSGHLHPLARSEYDRGPADPSMA